jgi:bile acid acyltransferase/acyl-CoA thioester hydrolase-like protein/acyl-CoA thioester hydrolase/bile acid acetyltransferase-like protein
MRLNINPLIALVDEKVAICISEVPPYGKVKISCSLCLPWAKDVPFESSAWFTADATGRVDLSCQKPDAGSYDFVDSMGLIDSVKTSDPKAIEKLTQNISVNESFFIDISAECEKDHTSTRLERLFKTADIKIEKITDEFIGDFFYSENPQNKTILWLGGSGSNLAINSLVCAPLASRGFNVLSVPFFGEKGLPEKLSRIPLEYFEKVFAWLAKHPMTSGKEFRILGMSKGAEAALLLASRYPFIHRMVLWAPHAYCFQGIAFKNESSWTYAGKDLPYIEMKNIWVIESMLHCMIKNEPFGFTPTFKKSLTRAKNKESARIQVENAQADLLMVTSTDCGMWNTYEGSVEIMDRLKRNNYPHSYDLVVYEDAGEPYLVPYVIPVSINSVKMAPRLVLSTGGTLRGNAYARADAWKRAIEFLGK